MAEVVPGRTYKIQTAATAGTPSVTWTVKTAPGSFTVDGGPDEKPSDGPAPDVAADTHAVMDADADVTIGGTPTDVLRWSWNRETPGAPSQVEIKGNPEAQAELKRCIVLATQ